ncbi:MAG: stage II sporulation protein R [Clostridia bacterium]|nr:stage II sporulation protein R [Clostridia bacterium]
MKNIKQKIISVFEKLSRGNLALKSLCFAIVFSLIFQFAVLGQNCENIRENIFRLHILANSNSDADQALKLKVRDRLLEVSEDLFDGAESYEDAVEISTQNIDFLTSVAKEEITANGYDYDVKISVGEADFNTRHYENYTLPAGKYTALRVVIGKGEGKNWWCVMFPFLCIPSAEEKATSSLSNTLDKEGVDLVCNGEKYKIKFKTVEIYEWIKSKIS